MMISNKKGSIVVTDKSTGGFESITGPMVMTSAGPMYGVHIKGSPNTLWMTTLGTECWEYYKKPEVGIKRINSMQAVDILRKAATGEYKSYEIKFNYHVSDAPDSVQRVVDEVYIKYEEEEVDGMVKIYNVRAIQYLNNGDMIAFTIIDDNKNNEKPETWFYAYKHATDISQICKFYVFGAPIDYCDASAKLLAKCEFNMYYTYSPTMDRNIVYRINFIGAHKKKEEEENMTRYAHRVFSMSHAVCDWVNGKAEVSDKNGNTYSFDDSTNIYLRDGSTYQPKKITFARAANILLHNVPDSIKIGAYIITVSRRITLMYIYCDNELEKLKEENKRLRDKIDKRKALLNSMYGISALSWSDMWPTSMIDTEKEKEDMKFLVPKIKKVLYNEPAVIVFWEDDTKTVVRAQDGEPYDKEKGLGMAISKKALGNDRDYYETFIRSKAVPKPKKGKKKDKKE